MSDALEVDVFKKKKCLKFNKYLLKIAKSWFYNIWSKFFFEIYLI